MSGHIQKKGNNWYCVIERGYGEDGKRLTPLWYSARKELGLNKPATKTQTRELLVKLLAEKQTGQIFKPKQVKLEEYLHYWHAQYASAKNLATKTREQQLFAISHITPILGQHELAKIQPSHVQEFLAAKRKDYAASTVQVIYKVLNLAFKHAVKWQYIINNPMDNVVRPTVPRPVIEYWTEEETATFLASVKQHKYCGIYRLALGCGLRKSEILNLKCAQVDYRNNTVTILDAKTKSGWRTVDMSPQITAALPVKGKDEYVFVNGNNKPIHPTNMNELLDTAIKYAGVKRITFHGLRHTHATIMLSRGVNIRVLAEILGHTNPTQLWQTYAHLLPSKQKEAARMMDDLLLE